MTSKNAETRPRDDPYNCEEWRSEPFRYWGGVDADTETDTEPDNE